MPRRHPLRVVRLGRVLAAALCAVSLCVWIPGDLYAAAATKSQAKQHMAPAKTQGAGARTGTVYDGEPPVTSRELDAFLEVMPRFRSWAKERGEEVHPSLTRDKADFFYSANAASWVREHGWQPKRFFCVMGRMAAAMVIVEEGNDLNEARPKDMPSVTQAELDLARKNLASLLRVGGDAPAPAAVKPKYPAPQQFAAPRYARP